MNRKNQPASNPPTGAAKPIPSAASHDLSVTKSLAGKWEGASVGAAFGSRWSGNLATGHLSATNLVRFPAQVEPLPVDRVFRLANRLSVYNLLVILSYTSVLFSLFNVLQVAVFPLALFLAFGIYHANLLIHCAEYYGRPIPVYAHWLWPITSALLAFGLMVLGLLCLLFGAGLGFGGALIFISPFCSFEESLPIAAVTGAIPGICLGVMLASSAIVANGKRWLKLA